MTLIVTHLYEKILGLASAASCGSVCPAPAGALQEGAGQGLIEGDSRILGWLFVQCAQDAHPGVIFGSPFQGDSERG